MTPIDLPATDHAARRDRARRALRDASTSDRAVVLLVTDPVNVRYLSGFTGSNGQLIIGEDVELDRLVTDARYEQRAQAETAGLPTTLSRDPFEIVLDVTGSGGHPAVAVEADHLTWATARQLERRAEQADAEVLPTVGLVTALRIVKDAAEITRLAQACALTEQALTWLLNDVVAEGRKERELATMLERRFVDLGADGVAFPSIVAGGPNGATPHHDPTDRPLRRGELLTIDCGAMVDGYHADCTRTVAIGSIGTTLADVHALVVDAQTAGRAAAHAGARAGDVDAAARRVIEEAGYGEWFVHGTGHGVGLEIHEAPSVARGSSATLADGMALTVEPGVYLPGVGGVRIEDTIVVTADGPARPLTDTPRGLRVL